jgi:protein-tyrosine-phosphatase
MAAVSSGSFPSGRLNPRAVSTLRSLGIDTSTLYSKGSDSFRGNPPDIVITVCDKAAGEPCPVYLGPAIKSHWGLADPSEVEGSDEEIQAAFDATVAHIRRRFAAFFVLDFKALSAAELKHALDQIGALT